MLGFYLGVSLVDLRTANSDLAWTGYNMVQAPDANSDTAWSPSS